MLVLVSARKLGVHNDFSPFGCIGINGLNRLFSCNRLSDLYRLNCLYGLTISHRRGWTSCFGGGRR